MALDLNEIRQMRCYANEELILKITFFLELVFILISV